MLPRRRNRPSTGACRLVAQRLALPRDERRSRCRAYVPPRAPGGPGAVDTRQSPRDPCRTARVFVDADATRQRHARWSDSVGKGLPALSLREEVNMRRGFAAALLLLLLAAPYAVAVPLRAPGASTNDGYIFVGGLGST